MKLVISVLIYALLIIILYKNILGKLKSMREREREREHFVVHEKFKS